MSVVIDAHHHFWAYGLDACHETNLALARLSSDERDRIFGGTAIAFYRLPVTARK